jgi:hypothetical protein
MIEHLIQELIDALNRNTAAVTAFTLPTAAPAKRSRAKADSAIEAAAQLASDTKAQLQESVITGLQEVEEKRAELLGPAEAPAPEAPATVEPEPEPQPEPAGEVTHDMILNIVREFRKGLDTTNYAKSKADLKVVLDRFGIEALSKADKKDLPELLTAVQAICQ